VHRTQGCLYEAGSLFCCYVALCTVYRGVYMEQVCCSVVMLHCAAVYRDVYIEEVGCSVVMLHCAQYIGVFIWSKYAVLLLCCTVHSI